MLRALLDEATLREADEQLETRGYKPHEFGDSVPVGRPSEPRCVARWLGEKMAAA